MKTLFANLRAHRSYEMEPYLGLQQSWRSQSHGLPIVNDRSDWPNP